MSSSSDDRCRALTEDGERCSRPAGEDGFCHQHDESDRTVDDGTGDSDGETDQRVDESGEHPTGESSDGTTEESNGESSGDGQHEPLVSEIVEVRQSVEAIGHDLIGHEIDGIVEVSRNGDGWDVTVEVVERASVPDTQDILGRYEIELTSDRTVSGYRRVDQYRRSDTGRDHPPG